MRAEPYPVRRVARLQLPLEEVAHQLLQVAEDEDLRALRVGGVQEVVPAPLGGEQLGEPAAAE